MKTLIRLFFKTLRIVLGPFILLRESLTRPKGVVRSAAAQARVEAASRDLVLYQFRTCPFCVKVRRTLAALSLPIELRDAQHDPVARRELEEGGGKVQVPCLRVTAADGSHTWLYESDAVNQHLTEFAARFDA